MSILTPLPDIRTGVYHHYKGQDYDVLGVVRHSESGEALVLYRPLYGERGLWVRPFVIFSETIEVEGQLKQRFKWVESRESATEDE